MARTVYECMFILNPNAYAKNPSGAANTVEQLISSVGGKILASRLWNEQKLAYPINGHRKGVYWLTYIDMESTDMSKFNRQCQLTDIVMRHLAIRIDPRLVRPVVTVIRLRHTPTRNPRAVTVELREAVET
ncbi:MAG: 30S ribosomal protein S6, partial [Planctomycetota bacterium]